MRTKYYVVEAEDFMVVTTKLFLAVRLSALLRREGIQNRVLWLHDPEPTTEMRPFVAAIAIHN